MARQLDFSPLDFRNAIMADPAGRAYAQAIGSAGQAIAGGIQRRQEKKEAIKKDFIEQMSYDTSITGNNIINNRVAYEYGNLRDKYLKVFQDRKGWLKPDDMIALKSDMTALTNLANTLKSEQNYYDNARQMATKNPGKYTLNTDSWANLMSNLTGDTTTTDLIGFLDSNRKSDSEFPYLDIRAQNVDIFNNKVKQGYRKDNAGDVSIDERIVERGGQKYMDTVTTQEYGNEDLARQNWKANVKGMDDPRGVTKGIQQELTDAQKAEAIKLYGPMSENPSDTPFIDYYGDYVLDAAGMAKPSVKAKHGERPVTGGGGGGLSLFFGGGKAGPGQYKPKPDNVEGYKVGEYVELAKAGRTPKTVKGVTVTGAQRLMNGEPQPAEDLTTPLDYQVVGYSLDKNSIIMTYKRSTSSKPRTYLVPYRNNEHFLTGLFDENTMQEIERRAANAPAPVPEEKPVGEYIAQPEWMKGWQAGPEAKEEFSWE